ncbi:MAG: rhodanese-like domain-containing protein [Candidatus Kapabacteria bacterium]|nr:rhodanese-like domain-containing protein [Candidatus Kapabacteria bacterium]
MKINFKNMTINQKLALFTLVLGFLALFFRDPLKAKIITVNSSEIALKVQDKSSNISVEELADWLIRKKADFKLIDLRSEAKFNEYNIPSSINMSSTELLSLKSSKNGKILIYSDDNLQAAEAWYLLKSKQYKAVYLLSGGINAWKDKILFPSISSNASADVKAQFAKLSEMSKFFGGSPRILSGDNSASAEVKMATPKIAPPPSAPAGKGGKAKRDGC